MDLFFYREPEELEKAEEAQAPFQEPAAAAASGWGADPMAGGAAPTPMEGFAAVDPAAAGAVPVEYQAPPQAGVGGGWDAAPAGAEQGVPVEQVQPVAEAMPVDAGVPPAAAGGWDAQQQQPVQQQQQQAPPAQAGGWGGAPAQSGGGW